MHTFWYTYLGYNVISNICALRCAEKAGNKITHKLWWDCLLQNVQSHSLAVSQGNDVMRLPFTKFAISLTRCWKDVMRLSFTNYAMSLTCWSWSWEKTWWVWLPFTWKCTMSLTCCSSWEKMWCLLWNVQYHSLAVGHRNWRCDEIAFHRKCNVTHSLLVM